MEGRRSAMGRSDMDYCSPPDVYVGRQRCYPSRYFTAIVKCTDWWGIRVVPIQPSHLCRIDTSDVCAKRGRNFVVNKGIERSIHINQVRIHPRRPQDSKPSARFCAHMMLSRSADEKGSCSLLYSNSRSSFHKGRKSPAIAKVSAQLSLAALEPSS